MPVRADECGSDDEPTNTHKAKMPIVVTTNTRSRTSARDGRDLTQSYVTKNRPRRGVRPKFLKFSWQTYSPPVNDGGPRAGQLGPGEALSCQGWNGVCLSHPNLRRLARCRSMPRDASSHMAAPGVTPASTRRFYVGLCRWWLSLWAHDQRLAKPTRSPRQDKRFCAPLEASDVGVRE